MILESTDFYTRLSKSLLPKDYRNKLLDLMRRSNHENKIYCKKNKKYNMIHNASDRLIKNSISSDYFLLSMEEILIDDPKYLSMFTGLLNFLNLSSDNVVKIIIVTFLPDNKGNVKPHIDEFPGCAINIPLDSIKNPIIWVDDNDKPIKKYFYDDYPTLIETEKKHTVEELGDDKRVFARIVLNTSYPDIIKNLGEINAKKI